MRILIADDHPLMQEALKRLFSELSQDACVMEAPTLDAARAALAEHRDVRLVVLEPALAGAPALSALDALTSVAGDAHIVVLSTRDDPATARAVLEAGARGFISKRSPRRVVLEALRLVLFGGTYVPPEALREPVPQRSSCGEVTRGVSRAETPRSGDPLATLGLTPRQRDVLAQLVQGKSNKQICRDLNLAEATVKVHTAAIFRALDAMNRTQALCALSRRGISLAAVARWVVSKPAAPATSTAVAGSSSRPAFGLGALAIAARSTI